MRVGDGINISILPGNIQLEVKEPILLKELMNKEQLPVEFLCGGSGTCGKCKVYITKGNNKNYTAEELKYLSKEELDKGIRLACQFKITMDTCVILPTISSREKVSIYTKENNNQKYEYGFAIDIGTTTIVSSLYNLTKKQCLVTITKNNPQIKYGADVLTRAEYASKDDGRASIIQDCLLKEINHIIEISIKEANIKLNQIVKIVFVGNTIMSHLVLKKPVENLLRAPFTWAFEGSVCFGGNELAIRVPAKTQIVMLPNIAGLVGSDLIGGILETQMEQCKENAVLIDIGTNGEIVACSRTRIVACSTAAGPAFEGASLSMGMRCEKGAIKGASWSNGLCFSIHESKEPVGVCGSGIIDIIAELRKHEVIDNSGLIQNEDRKVVLATVSREKELELQQRDVREVQLAKSAIISGVYTLLHELNLTVEELDHIYVAGTFGNHLNIKNAMMIGLLPNVDMDKIHLIGNSSLYGASEILLEYNSLNYIDKLISKISHIELANSELFKQLFIENMAL